jgi:hypothetical protein
VAAVSRPPFFVSAVERSRIMFDLICIAIAVAFFAIAAKLARGCDKLD